MRHFMLPLQDDIPFPPKGLTLFTCVRGGSEPRNSMIVRKFKSDCGNVFEVHITHRNHLIRSIKALYDCQPNCQMCAKRIQRIHDLIAIEKQTS
jgi:hypothetical protein